MDSRNAVVDQIDRLLSGVLDADLKLVVLVVAFTHRRCHVVGDPCFAHRCNSLGLFEVGYREDAGHNRDIDAGGLACITEPIEIRIVVEKLGRHDVGAGVDFPFEVVQVCFGIRSFLMNFRIASDGNAELAAEFGTNQLHEFIGIPQSSFDRFELLTSLGRIATQRDDVIGPPRLGFREIVSELLHRRSDAGEVWCDGQAGDFPHPLHDVQRLGLGWSAGAVGAGKVARAESLQPFDIFLQQGHSFVGLGRKQLEGDGRMFVSVLVGKVDRRRHRGSRGV